MAASKALKIATLGCFTCLIAAFIAYRADAFDSLAGNNVLPDEENAAQDTSETAGADSAKAASAAMMSSSKSAIIFRDEKSPVVTKKKPAAVKEKEEALLPGPVPLPDEELNLMSSSKSAIIFRPGKASSDPSEPKPTDNKIIRTQAPLIFGKKQAATDTLKHPE